MEAKRWIGITEGDFRRMVFEGQSPMSTETHKMKKVLRSPDVSKLKLERKLRLLDECFLRII